MVEGQKFSEGKLPIYQVLMVQFRRALQEVAKSSQAGHSKYTQDLDWLNFTRVPNGQFQFLNAAMRHLMEAEDHTYNEDMKEYGQIRHRAQAIWNLLVSLELELRDEELLEQAKEYTDKKLEEVEYPRVGSDIPSYRSIWDSPVDNPITHFRDPDKVVKPANLDEWMAKHKVANELKDMPTEEHFVIRNDEWHFKNPDFVPYDFPQKSEIKGNVHTFGKGWSRPTLTVDRLLSQEKHEDYYPDQEIN